MITLRPYQENAVEAVLDFIKNGKPKNKPIVVAPTGAGKSIIIAAITKAVDCGVLVLQPSKELLEQNFYKYESYGGVAAIYSASMNTKHVDHVTFATIGSVEDMAHLFCHVGLVLIDECHLVPPTKDKVSKRGALVKKASMYRNFLEQLDPKVKIVGLTATAVRLKKYNDPFTGEAYSQVNLLTREVPRFFNTFLHITQIRELYEMGYLTQVKYIPLAWSNGSLKYNSTGAEYAEESMDAAMKEQKILEKIPGIIKQSIDKGRKHRLVFVKSIEDAENLSKEIPHSGCVHSKMKKNEREGILDDFKNGRIKTIFNVGVLTVGFDFPELDTIIIARPTMSLTLYMQMVGRGMRIHKDKSDCALVDMCGNIDRFGKIEDIEYTKDYNGDWVLHDGRKQISGVRLSTIC